MQSPTHSKQNTRPAQTPALTPRLSDSLPRPALLLGLALGVQVLLAGCASGPTSVSTPAYSQASLPDAVKVPSGHQVVLETVGIGSITYQCRAKASAAGQFEWVFVGPDAVLNARSGKALGKYYGPPATWESADGSKVTGAQLAVAPASPGNIPLQLVKANPATGDGAMKGISFIQRVQTKGGVAPATVCDATTLETKQVVKYQSDYIFYKSVN
jgi:hypothetical protein